MSRDQLVAAMKRNIVHSQNGTVPLDDGIKRVPAKNSTTRNVGSWRWTASFVACH